jgi:hypothetical protein
MSLFDKMVAAEQKYKAQKQQEAAEATVLSQSSKAPAATGTAAAQVVAIEDGNGNDRGKATVAAAPAPAADDDKSSSFLSPLKPARPAEMRASTAKRPITFWDTQVPRSVKPKDLVFAPYYRMKDKLVPARLCTAAECASETYIPIQKEWGGAVPVEFICMEDRQDTRILLVVAKNVVPYWNFAKAAAKNGANGVAAPVPDGAEPATEWNKDQLDLMHQALHAKYSAKVADEAFSRTTQRANEFLRQVQRE